MMKVRQVLGYFRASEEFDQTRRLTVFQMDNIATRILVALVVQKKFTMTIAMNEYSQASSSLGDEFVAHADPRQWGFEYFHTTF